MRTMGRVATPARNVRRVTITVGQLAFVLSVGLGGADMGGKEVNKRNDHFGDHRQHK